MAPADTSVLGDPSRIVGPGASALKYDILTALLVSAACGAPDHARLATRLTLLITARFNWRSGMFAVGRREMAAMWAVTERTAKRDLARMKALGWVSVAVPAARGRVAQYRIDLGVVMQATRPAWDAVGPDFVARMTGVPDTPAPEASNVVPLRVTSVVEDNGTGWAQAAQQLRAENPALFEAWFAGLQAVEVSGGVLTLAAPSRFVANYVQSKFGDRLLAAVTTANRGVRALDVRCDV
jgi:hypothetical protein